MLEGIYLNLTLSNDLSHHGWITPFIVLSGFFGLQICCVFRPNFGCCAHQKAGRNFFFSHFSTFFVHFKAFSVKFNRKKTNSRYPPRESTSFCMSTRRSRQNHVFLIHFQTFFVDFSREISEKALKLTKKGARSTRKLDNTNPPSP